MSAYLSLRTKDPFSFFYMLSIGNIILGKSITFKAWRYIGCLVGLCLHFSTGIAQPERSPEEWNKLISKATDSLFFETLKFVAEQNYDFTPKDTVCNYGGRLSDLSIVCIALRSGRSQPKVSDLMEYIGELNRYKNLCFEQGESSGDTTGLDKILNSIYEFFLSKENSEPMVYLDKLKEFIEKNSEIRENEERYIKYLNSIIEKSNYPRIIQVARDSLFSLGDEKYEELLSLKVGSKIDTSKLSGKLDSFINSFGEDHPNYNDVLEIKNELFKSDPTDYVQLVFNWIKNNFWLTIWGVLALLLITIPLIIMSLQGRKNRNRQIPSSHSSHKSSLLAPIKKFIGRGSTIPREDKLVANIRKSFDDKAPFHETEALIDTYLELYVEEGELKKSVEDVAWRILTMDQTGFTMEKLFKFLENFPSGMYQEKSHITYRDKVIDYLKGSAEDANLGRKYAKKYLELPHPLFKDQIQAKITYDTQDPGKDPDPVAPFIPDSRVIDVNEVTLEYNRLFRSVGYHDYLSFVKRYKDSDIPDVEQMVYKAKESLKPELQEAIRKQMDADLYEQEYKGIYGNDNEIEEELFRRGKTVKFAQYPHPDGYFDELWLEDRPTSNSIFQLYLDEEKQSADFVIRNDEEVFRRLLSTDFSNIDKMCEFESKGKPQDKRKIKTVDSGKLYFQGGRWLLRRKAKIDFE